MRNQPFYRLLCCLLSLILLSCLPGNAYAAEPVQIHTVDDLLAMAEAPGDSYILMADLDMTGIPWVGPDFAGTFDGNGHAILNLTLSGLGSTAKTTCDGNLKTYESQFAGFFSTLDGATVKNLNLVGIQALVETDQSCFLGGIAGYARNTSFQNCSVTGHMELRAFNKMFGIGGLVGYGSGKIDGCAADVTLISVDTDKARDEMFLGGLVGMGFFDMTNCVVTLDGYASEYGYVHSGGLMGMMIRYPLGDWTAAVTGNSVTGKITFFECNTDRRAYCDAFIGEQMTKYCNLTENTSDFLQDERTEYTELRPELCKTPTYTEAVTAPVCNAYGYTTYTCGACGYAYRDHYTRYGDHQVTRWSVLEAATEEAEGLLAGQCDLCGETQQATSPRLEPQPTEPPTDPPAPTAAPTAPKIAATEQTEPDEKVVPWPLWAACAAILLSIAWLVFRPRHRGRYQK